MEVQLWGLRKASEGEAVLKFEGFLKQLFEVLSSE